MLFQLSLFSFFFSFSFFSFSFFTVSPWVILPRQSNHVPVLLNFISSSQPGLVVLSLRSRPVAFCTNTLHQLPPGTARTATSAIDSYLLGCHHLEQPFHQQWPSPHQSNDFTSIPLIWQHRFLHLSAKHTITRI